MNIADVMDELGVALDTIAGLRVHPYSADRINPPAAMVLWPDPLDYDTTMARGMDRMTLPVVVLVGKVDARTARDLAAKYLDGSGSSSVKAAVDGGTYSACDSVRALSATVGAYSVAGVTYLGVEFQVDITGQGA